ncbi:recombinase family protein [Cryobacterium zhongshanensis]|uniref:Recombinase family protein n=1 Tax=Cryobacterium zhongshanensis TaxID=2928153 RepID=A0AA41QUV6_9MICO|nr:recombinase family protein [Cryobacterium zhongshanensis]MCI4657139.1 recombinase family protein [Cryobacterium zhongshanensis]
MAERAAIYCRISERDESFDKVELQERRLRRLAEDSGYEVEGVFRDDGISAFSGKARPAYIEMLAGIRQRRFDVVMAVAPDRFTRNVAEGEALQVVCADVGTVFHTLTNGISDPRSATNAAMSSIVSVLAQMESAIKTERLRARFAERTADGRPLWGARPFGYEKDRMTIRESEAELIRWAYQAILDGNTLGSVQRHFNALGVTTSTGRPWSYQGVRTLLTRVSNAGWLTSHGAVLKESKISRIVPTDVFESVVAILDDPGRESTPGPKSLKNYATGLAVCGTCGAKMRSAVVILKGRHTAIYKCASAISGNRGSVRHTTIQVDILHALIVGRVIDVIIENRAKSLPGTPKAEVHRLRSELAETHRKRTQLNEVALMPGADLVDIRHRLAGFASTSERLSNELDLALSSDAEARLLDSIRDMVTFDVVMTAADWTHLAQLRGIVARNFVELTVDQKRRLVGGMFSITIEPGRNTDRVKFVQR